MNKHRISVALSTFIIVALLIISTGTNAFTWDLSNVATYEVKEYDKYETLCADAEMLDFDFEKADYEFQGGWHIFSTAEYEIRRHDVSGYFTYVHKHTEWPAKQYEIDSRFENALKEETIELLTSLDVPVDEIHEVAVKRVVQQDEDELGNDTGPKEIVGYLVYITRQLNGILVNGATIKAMYSTNGQLHKLNINWRTVERNPLNFNEIRDFDMLRREGQAIVRAIEPGTEAIVYGDNICYLELPYDELQTTFTLQYVFTYSFGSFLMRESISAIYIND